MKKVVVMLLILAGVHIAVTVYLGYLGFRAFSSGDPGCWRIIVCAVTHATLVAILGWAAWLVWP